MKKILLLGATGAMGVFLVDILRKNSNYKVYVTSRSLHSNTDNIVYLLGNARDDSFMAELLEKNHYDVIVDFMNYGYQEFQDYHKRLLAACDHYIFLSSCRVFAESTVPITEDSPRLLDVSTDQEFLATQRYALRKARQENMLNESGFSNFTIVRPYITYSNARLQLGIYEKEQWLYRVLRDKPIVISEGVLEKTTALSYGFDVALGIFKVFDKSVFLNDSINIVTSETIKWSDVLSIYENVVYQETGKKVNVYISSENHHIENLFEGGYNTIYDRKWDRTFNNSKLLNCFPDLRFQSVYDILPNMVTQFIDRWKKDRSSVFLPIVDEFEAYSDLMTGSLEADGNDVYKEIIHDKRNSYLSKKSLKRYC
jgi:nucleoside-diphosphate-sugar epimerase